MLQKPVCTLPQCKYCSELHPIEAIEYFLSESNKIEGIIDGDSLQQALYAWEYLTNEDKLTGGAILKTHKILMLHHKLPPDQRGYWRREDVKIGYYEAVGIHPDGKRLIKKFVKTGEVVEWRHIPDLMKSWTERANLQVQYPGSRIDEDIKKHHVSYEHIHPFIDGNGRTGRMFMNWQRLKAGLPLLIVHNENKQDYYAWFKQTS